MMRSNYFIFLPLLVYDYLMEHFGDEIVHEFEHYILKNNRIDLSYRFDNRVSLKGPHLLIAVNENGYTIGISGCRPTMITPAWIRDWCANNSNMTTMLEKWNDA